MANDLKMCDDPHFVGAVTLCQDSPEKCSCLFNKLGLGAKDHLRNVACPAAEPWKRACLLEAATENCETVQAKVEYQCQNARDTDQYCQCVLDKVSRDQLNKCLPQMRFCLNRNGGGSTTSTEVKVSEPNTIIYLIIAIMALIIVLALVIIGIKLFKPKRRSSVRR